MVFNYEIIEIAKYSKPIPYEEIIEGIKKEKFIGIENSEESDYYIQLGRVNLYNLSFSIRDDEQHVDYFDTWPMVMVECKDGKLNFVRANITFKGYIKENFPDLVGKTELDIADFAEKTGNRSLNSIMMCAEDGKRVIIDDVAASGKALQILVWRIAVNPVTKVAAVMVVVLSSTDEHNEKLR